MATQKVTPDEYSRLKLEDQWIEDCVQDVEARWLIEQTKDSPCIIDLGWGSGIVAKALHAAGRDVMCVEGSKAACKEARDAGIPVIHSLFENFKAADDFDCVIASFILEHVADPVALLKRCREWAPRLIAVVGNANSYHRRLAVAMGLQPRTYTLSARDHAVGHYCVYDRHTIAAQLSEAGWRIKEMHGIMLKPLPNAMMTHFDERLIRAMCEIEIAPQDAANIGIVCERA